MKKIALLFISILLIISCNSTKNLQEDYVIVSMKKTDCRGKCPVFQLEILKSGLVYYKGIKNVEPIGVYTKTLSKNEMNYIVKIFKSTNFYQFKDEYDLKATDLPSTYLSYNENGNQAKTIKARQEIPEKISFLIGEIDKMVVSGKWKEYNANDKFIN